MFQVDQFPIPFVIDEKPFILAVYRISVYKKMIVLMLRNIGMFKGEEMMLINSKAHNKQKRNKSDFFYIFTFLSGFYTARQAQLD